MRFKGVVFDCRKQYTLCPVILDIGTGTGQTEGEYSTAITTLCPTLRGQWHNDNRTLQLK